MTAMTVSPSSFTRSRSTPWVAGCWGPMLSTIEFSRGSSSVTVVSWSSRAARIWLLRVSSNVRVGMQDQVRVTIRSAPREGDRIRNPHHREIFAQRVVFKLFGHIHATKIGVARELDPEHVEGLPLVPVCARPDAG